MFFEPSRAYVLTLEIIWKQKVAMRKDVLGFCNDICTIRYGCSVMFSFLALLLNTR